MSREEAIAFGKRILLIAATDDDNTVIEFTKMAIQALSQEPCNNAISREDRLIDLANAIESDESGYWTNKRISSALRNISSVMQKSETVTEFADRCRECGAKYGKLLEQKSGEWIPINNGLPEDKTYVLTTIKVPNRIAHARSSWYEGGFFHNDNGDTWRATDMEVRAWMPLPKPYEPQESEDKE